MLAFAILVTSAAAMEIGLNMTGSGTAQAELSTAASSAPETISEVIITLSQVSSSSTSSAPETVSEIIVTLSEVSSSSTSLANSTSLVASPTITDGPIYTNDCSTFYGRNCDRLPEQPVSNEYPSSLQYTGKWGEEGG